MNNGLLFFISLIPFAIVSTMIIYSWLVKYFKLSQAKKILLSALLEILYIVVMVGYILIGENYLRSIDSSYFYDTSTLWVPIVAGIFTLYFVQYSMAKNLSEVEFDKGQIVSKTIGIIALNCITPAMLVLVIATISWS